ncbi:MAG: hypothetical protein K2L49_01625 [Muribaculaceae bacterium]|nr:hypothetical protein [Muribaculaceae bacterium]
MRKLLTILLISIVCATMTAATGWERTDTLPDIPVENVESETAAIGGRDGCIYLQIQRKTEVTVFTILGHTVIRQQLAPGFYRLPVSSRGIYIVKIGASTRRIVL